LKFDEPCLGFYVGKDKEVFMSSIDFNAPYQFKLDSKTTFVAPTFSQAFRFFREKYGLYHSIGLDNSLENDINCDYQIINHSQSISELETNFKTYEEAELECLKKLIEIVKEKK
jgi:hypothetical protein